MDKRKFTPVFYKTSSPLGPLPEKECFSEFFKYFFAYKCHYLEERAVDRMRKTKVGLAIHGEQGMESANQSRKQSAKRTKTMNSLKGLMTDAKRLCQDKHQAMKGRRN